MEDGSVFTGEHPLNPPQHAPRELFTFAFNMWVLPKLLTGIFFYCKLGEDIYFKESMRKDIF